MKTKKPKLIVALKKIKPNEVAHFGLIHFISKEHAAKVLGLAVAKRLYEGQQ